MTSEPIDKNTAFDLETTQVLSCAFDKAWKSVQESGSQLAAEANAEYVRTTLAKHILELGARGELDPQQLATSALAHLALYNLAHPLDAA